MSNNVKNAIDELENKIKEYRKDCLNLSEARMLIAKLNHEIDNVQNRWEYDDEDLEFVQGKLVVAMSDAQWFIEAMEISLHAVKHAAYRLGKMRSFVCAEP